MSVPLSVIERAPLNRVSAQRDRLLSAFNGLHLFNVLPDPFLIVNEYRQIVFANQAVSDLFGPADVLAARPGEISDCHHAFEMAQGCGTTVFCQACGSLHTLLASLDGFKSSDEWRITRRDGSALDLRVWGYPLELDNERFSIFVIRDISHEKRRQVLEKLFAHDILNMLSAVMGYVGYMKRIGVNGDAENAIQVIEEVSRQMAETIQAHRQIEEAESGELAVHQHDINTLELLRQIVRANSALEVAKGRVIEIAPTAKSVCFYSDVYLLERVLGNMVKNALEASAEGQIITLSCGSEGESVWFEVHNPAVMPEDVQLQVFQRSFSTKGTGRGLGTYSMKLLTERYLKGKISFTSTPENGTTFRAVYPLNP